MSKFWLWETDWSGYDFTSLLNRLLGPHSFYLFTESSFGSSLILGVDVSISQLPWGTNSHWSLLAYSGCRMWYSIVLVRAYHTCLFSDCTPILVLWEILALLSVRCPLRPSHVGLGAGSSLSVWLLSVTFAKLLVYPIVAGWNKTIQRQEHSIVPCVGQHLVFQ